MSRSLVVGKRPCMWCDPMRLTEGTCSCGAAICSTHIATYGPLCPLCVRFGQARSVVVLPIDWTDTDKTTIPVIEAA